MPCDVGIWAPVGVFLGPENGGERFMNYFGPVNGSQPHPLTTQKAEFSLQNCEPQAHPRRQTEKAQQQIQALKEELNIREGV